MFDTIIIGGSSAGLSAALVLGRSRRRALVLDDGQPCNRFSHASHGFLTRDGVAPAELVQIAREQISAYPTVQFVADTVTGVASVTSGFEVQTVSGQSYLARKLLLATGVKDALPAIPGIEALWGRSVFHCPYCDGWEVRDKRLVVLATSAVSFHQVMMIHHWSADLTVCTNAQWSPDDDQLRLMQKHNIALDSRPVVRLDGAAGQIQQIVFDDGAVLACDAMFINPGLQHRHPLAEMLGCAINEQHRVEVDILGRTSVPGVYAAGDITTPMRSVAVAVAGGSMAASGMNFDMVAEDFYAD